MEEENTSSGVQAKQETHKILNSTPTRSPGLGCLKNDAQVSYRAQIRRSKYARKLRNKLPIPPIPYYYHIRVNGNR
jgi:hypothetical protein